MRSVIRRATPDDLSAIGGLGALLLRAHYDFDPQRFLSPAPDAEHGYGQFLETQIGREEALVLVAERDGHIVGYLYAGIEPHNWKELRERAGFVHDILVTEDARGSGAGRELMDAAFAWMREQRVPRVLLWTAAANGRARDLFERLGFRATMVEMTRELE